MSHTYGISPSCDCQLPGPKLQAATDHSLVLFPRGINFYVAQHIVNDVVNIRGLLWTFGCGYFEKDYHGVYSGKR